MGEPVEPVTEILDAAGAGDAQAAEKLLPLVYEELRRLAAAKMAPRRWRSAVEDERAPATPFPS